MALAIAGRSAVYGHVMRQGELRERGRGVERAYPYVSAHDGGGGPRESDSESASGALEGASSIFQYFM